MKDNMQNDLNSMWKKIKNYDTDDTQNLGGYIIGVCDGDAEDDKSIRILGHGEIFSQYEIAKRIILTVVERLKKADIGYTNLKILCDGLLAEVNYEACKGHSADEESDPDYNCVAHIINGKNDFFSLCRLYSIDSKIYAVISEDDDEDIGYTIRRVEYNDDNTMRLYPIEDKNLADKIWNMYVGDND